jgi:hypothetical protein
MDLAFEDAELVAEGENLELERCFGLPAEDKEVEQGADDVEAIIAGRITGTIHILERHTPYPMPRTKPAFLLSGGSESATGASVFGATTTRTPLMWSWSPLVGANTGVKHCGTQDVGSTRCNF